MRIRAFSLVEVVLVLAILGVLAALAAPRYGDALDRYRADAAARRIVADVALARTDARTTGLSRSITFDLAAGTYRLAGQVDLDRSTPYIVTLSADPYRATIDQLNLSGGTTTLNFNGFGFPDRTGSIRVRSGRVSRTVSIDRDSGVASIQ